MISQRSSRDFDIDALYAALDAQRTARGLSWQQVMREVNGQFKGLSIRPTSTSTITGMRNKSVIEADGVLSMLRWLGRTPENFSAANTESGIAPAPLPDVPSNRILRFDAQAIYSALDAQRTKRGMTWKAVAEEIGGFNAPGLTRLAKGGRVGFPSVMRIFRWLDRPAASFTRIANW